MNESSRHDRVRALQWRGESLALLDQRRLPRAQEWIHCDDAVAVAQAIRELAVRGAPAIGIAAAYGVVLAVQRAGSATAAGVRDGVAALRASRPTAVNLFWALDRMQRAIDTGADAAALDREARAIEAEDLAANRRMGALGAGLIAPGSGVLTHCNTGSLATAGYGTALGVIRAGVAQGRIARVFHTETRPWLQGARLTAWELREDGIPARLVADGDMFAAISDGRAEVVTDHIDHFDRTGIVLKSGRRIDADIVVTATGLQLQALGGVRISLDGSEIRPQNRFIYKAHLLEEVPNLVWCVGYTNASWTLRADITARATAKLIEYMNSRGYTHAYPHVTDKQVPEKLAWDIQAGYVLRNLHVFPKSGTRRPWNVRQNYFADAIDYNFIDKIEEDMTFGRAPASIGL